MSCIYARRVASVVSNSMQPCRPWPARFPCQGSSPGKNTRAYWPYWLPHPSRVLYFLMSEPPTPLNTWCCQNPCDPSSCTTSTPGHHKGKPKFSRAASGANPSGRPTCRGGNKTTAETQRQCGQGRRPQTLPPGVQAAG